MQRGSLSTRRPNHYGDSNLICATRCALSELWATRENQDFAGEYLIHSLDEMRPYASFDFSFRPDVAFFELDPHDTSPRFRVITSHDRLKGDFVWGEPNQLIFEYLKDEYANHL